MKVDLRWCIVESCDKKIIWIFFWSFYYGIKVDRYPISKLIILPKRPEMVVGWYHSHPGFGCWLSGVDINTQQSFEALTERAVAVVVDPIQSVKGKVVIDAFRLINPNTMVLGHEPRQTTSNLGHLQKPSIQVDNLTLDQWFVCALNSWFFQK